MVKQIQPLPPFKPIEEFPASGIGYIPTVFNKGMDLYQAVCYLEWYVVQTYKSMNEVIADWNTLQEWIDTQLDGYAREQLQKWLDDGTLEKIINEEIFGKLNERVTTLETNVTYLMKRVIHMKDYVVPNGNDDNTALMQQAIDKAEGAILIIDGNAQSYRCSQLTLKSNSIYYCEENTVIKAVDTWIDSSRWQEPLIDIRLVNNVKWYGNGALITMNKPATLITEHAHCMGTRGATNVYVENMVLMNASGDGFYIDQYNDDKTNKPSSNVTLKGTKCDGNGRNGISVVSGYDILIEGCTLTNTKGTAPQAGIDVEAELRSPKMTNISIRDCNFSNNGFSGFIFAGGSSNPATEQSVYLDNCKFIEEPTALYVNGIRDNSQGEVVISNCYFKNTSRNAILDGNNSNKGIKRTYINCVSLNANTSNREQRDDQVGEWGWGCAFQVYARDKNCGNCRFINCSSDDDRDIPLVKTAFGLTRDSGSVNVINLVEFIGCYSYKSNTSLLANHIELYNIRVDETLPRNKVIPNSNGTDYINTRNNYCTIQGGIIYINATKNLYAEIEAINIDGNTTRLRAGSGVTFGNGYQNVRLTNKGSFVRLATNDGNKYYVKYGSDYTLD